VKESDIIDKLLIAFKDDKIKRQVLDSNWYQLNIERGIDSTGFCFSASEVLYRLTGGTEIWMVKRLIDPTNWNQGTHYFLYRKSNNEIVDITSNQYTERDIEIPYERGRGTGLRYISNKAKLLALLAGIGTLS
jgi:hypothetical protein